MTNGGVVSVPQNLKFCEAAPKPNPKQMTLRHSHLLVCLVCVKSVASLSQPTQPKEMNEKFHCWRRSLLNVEDTFSILRTLSREVCAYSTSLQRTTNCEQVVTNLRLVTSFAGHNRVYFSVPICIFRQPVKIEGKSLHQAHQDS